MDNFDYRKAEADLYDVGACHPEDVYEYRSEKALRGYMREHGLNPDKYIKSGGNSGSNSSSSSSGGCYLTTACVVARGLPDQCSELQTLRAFRDGYLTKQPGGLMEIDRYYQMAPGIVAAINQRADSLAIWSRVYDELVAPCVELIHDGQNATAHKLYREYAIKLGTEYAN